MQERLFEDFKFLKLNKPTKQPHQINSGKTMQNVRFNNFEHVFDVFKQMHNMVQNCPTMSYNSPHCMWWTDSKILLRSFAKHPKMLNTEYNYVFLQFHARHLFDTPLRHISHKANTPSKLYSPNLLPRSYCLGTNHGRAIVLCNAMLSCVVWGV